MKMSVTRATDTWNWCGSKYLKHQWLFMTDIGIRANYLQFVLT